MEIRQLRCFVAVAEELHFGRAAARLHVAQPAVSQTIRGLERELGLVLFDRANRRVTLTEAGGVLLAEARATLARVEDLVAAMARLREGVTGTVTIGAVPALPPELVPWILARVASRGPGPSAVVRAVPSGRSPSVLLDSGAVDIVLVRGVVHAPGLGAAVVARETVGVAVPAGHPIASRVTVTPADLAGVPLISFGRSSDPVEFDRIYGTLAAAGMGAPQLVHESHEGAVDASLRLVERGVGLSVKLQSEVAAFGSPALTWRPIEGVDLDVVVSAAWRVDRMTPALRHVIRLLVDDER